MILGSGRSPEKGIKTQSNIPTWEMSWTEEPGGLQSMGLQRVGHNLETKQPQRYMGVYNGEKSKDTSSTVMPPNNRV